MDNKTLKALIIKYKDQDNMTYQAISDKLAEEYGIIRSRQALQGMYQRAVKKNESLEQKDRFLATADIVNVYCLGYNMSEVREIVNEFGYNLSYNDVIHVIKEQESYIKEVEKEFTEKILNELNKSNYISDIKNVLRYKQVDVTEKRLKEYVADAYSIQISSNIKDLISRSFDYTDDKMVSKKIVKDLDLNMSIIDTKTR